ncbi:hypothetical protein E2562_011229 [Oryza meyeriana var. granulata]|uniref:Uncharacterized protein n=1 Tax=Oryza meyeriana var. granulata TaxID=110450 RepID=A0A6G1DGR3_9ORYZ|nr:hypothetical protein E2562_011229 [Oryza meyeriana var. granulata]
MAQLWLASSAPSSGPVALTRRACAAAERGAWQGAGFGMARWDKAAASAVTVPAGEEEAGNGRG